MEAGISPLISFADRSNLSSVAASSASTASGKSLILVYGGQKDKVETNTLTSLLLLRWYLWSRNKSFKHFLRTTNSGGKDPVIPE